MGFLCLLISIFSVSVVSRYGAKCHWVDTWWANDAVSPSNMSVVDQLDLKIFDYIQSKAISHVRLIIVQPRHNL